MEEMLFETASLHNYFIMTLCFQAGSQWRRMDIQENLF